MTPRRPHGGAHGRTDRADAGCGRCAAVEYAASLRDRLRAIQGLQNHQRVIATAYSDTDAVGFQRGAKCCFTVLHFTDGNLTGKDKSFLDEPMEPDGEALAALVSDEELCEDFIMPEPFDPRAVEVVAAAVANAVE